MGGSGFCLIEAVFVICLLYSDCKNGPKEILLNGKEVFYLKK